MAPPTELTVRMLRPAEAGVFWSLRLRALREHPEAFASSFEDEENVPLDVIRARLEGQSPESNLLLGAFMAERLVGLVGIRRDAFRKLAHRAHIWGMYVAAEHQGQGIGRRLIEAAIDAGRRMGGIEQLLLQVVEGNARADTLYRSLGFEAYGVDKRALRIGEKYYDEALMVLWL
jgi:ribosomal protein S18 acetylase RimI-like enzyme